MKKIITFLTLLISLFMFTSCYENDNEQVSLIVPSGAPTFGIADALNNNQEQIDYNIVAGADALQAAFTNATYDIVIAPVNLGAKFYQSLNNFEYVYYQTIVGGCFYIVSTQEIASFADLDKKEITVFGANSTPDVITRSLINYYNIDVTINYVNDVTEANASLVSGKATTIVSAEPSISKFNASGKFHTLSLQEEWKKISSVEFNIPQAGIFVKKDKLTNASVKKVLSELNKSLALANTNPSQLATSATAVDDALKKVGVDTLTLAAPRCNFISTKYNKQEVEFYFNKLIELGLGKTIGDSLPDEDFYA